MIVGNEKIKVKVGNGEVSIGSKIAWVPKYGSVRTGTVDLIAQVGGWNNSWKTKIRVAVDKKDGEFYKHTQKFYNLNRVITLQNLHIV